MQQLSDSADDRAGLFHFSRIGIPPSTTPSMRRMIAMEGELARGHALHFDLPAMTFISISGGNRDRVSAQAWSAASEDTGATSAPGSHPIYPLEARSPVPGVTYVDANVPWLSDVQVCGEHAAVEVRDVDGSLEVRTTHGKVLVLGSTGSAMISALDGGHVAFQGHRGEVDITADIGVDIRCLAEAFDGRLRVACRGDIWLVIPARFRDQIVAVGRPGDVVSSDGVSRLIEVRTDVPSHDTASPARILLASEQGRVYVIADAHS